MNPFFYGNAAPTDCFIGRRKELRRVIGRLMKYGQSSAIIGDPRVGKTSLLNYLSSQDIRSDLYGDKADRWHFFQIDLTMLESHCTPARFWEHALNPIKEQIEKESEDYPLLKSYNECCGDFGNFALEKLFLSLRKAGWRFILLLDELDNLLHHPVLNNAEFFGGLRALSSRSEGAFSIIFTSRMTLSQLNASTQEMNPTGSPFFNIFSEITLGPLADKETEHLFSLAKYRFTTSDKESLCALAGKHPYLLQAACAALWDAYNEERMLYPADYNKYMTDQLCRELRAFFPEIWKVWSPELRKAFTTVAVAHQVRLMSEKNSAVSNFLERIHEWKPELEDLRERGWIIKDENCEGGYSVAPRIMLTWLADELIRIGREEKESKDPFEKWLSVEGIDGTLTINEKKLFKNMLRSWAGTLGQGTTTIIQASCAGLGFGMAQTAPDNLS